MSDSDNDQAMRPDGAMMRRQAILDDAATRIEDLVARESDAGYGGLVVHPQRATLQMTVFWHGDVPQPMADLLSRLHEREGIEVAVTPSPYGRQQLREMLEQLMVDSERQGARITMGRLLPGAAGIQLEVDGDEGDARSLVAATAGDVRVEVRQSARDPAPATAPDLVWLLDLPIDDAAERVRAAGHGVKIVRGSVMSLEFARNRVVLHSYRERVHWAHWS
ncbi:MAG: hypothetical protein JOY80_01875 [Candidatus Dormibacteraeota bacterium]|nr:hypothetical protein [Candidatus Dormibacteraeota bacterium]